MKVIIQIPEVFVLPLLLCIIKAQLWNDENPACLFYICSSRKKISTRVTLGPRIFYVNLRN